MLRVSARIANSEIDIHMINGESSGNSTGIQFGEELMHFAEALSSGDEGRLTTARTRLLDIAGPGVLVDTAGVAANFQRMVRIADAMGIPVDTVDSDLSNEVRRELDLYRFESAANSKTEPA